MNPFRTLQLAIALGVVFSTPLKAQSLLDLYDAARSFDATYQSVRSQVEATVARAEQSRAGILPTVNLAISGSRSQVDSSQKIPNPAFGAVTGTLSASQPIYRPAN